MNDVLKLMNEKRRLHGSPPLVWCDSCAKTAQSYAQSLASTRTFAHGMLRDASGNPVGQNLACATTPTGVWPATNAVTMWYDEVKLYDFKNPAFSPSTGHFTALVWKSTTKVGIGSATVNGYTVVVANFSSPGNVRGQFPQNVLPKIIAA